MWEYCNRFDPNWLKRIPVEELGYNTKKGKQLSVNTFSLISNLGFYPLYLPVGALVAIVLVIAELSPLQLYPLTDA